MIPKEKMDECVVRFTQNPYWRAYLDNAPESAKEYIRMEFAFSLLGDEDRNDEEFKAALNKSRKELPADALKYLYENEKNMTAKNIYKKMLDAKTATPDGGKRMHITEDAMHSALEAFIGRPLADERGNVVWDGGNEYWRDLFMEAPTGARLRLSLNFYFSENHERPDFPMLEYRAIRKAIEDAMDFDSLEYLIANESNEAAKNHYIDIWKARMGVKEGKVKGDGLEAMNERGGKLAARSDEKWFALMHRCGNVTCKAACGTSYERVTGKRFPIESYRKWEASLAKKTSCWRGVWLSAADYAAAPEWAKRYCEHHRWVEYIGKDELPDGKDGRKMDSAYICTKMEDADWDFLIKHTHSYARGMPLVMARRHYQRKDVLGNPISSPLEADK